ncbi:uncharacterized protein LOC128235700 [Mya arenaria]|uniref:uncharacterized protein LOC128235700 n=1 Tax=Mya arenaria TaxID=6604 RepID=UPI0022E591DD|nr:uncharacterized protein LOC128235700 [Mya arenaria]
MRAETERSGGLCCSRTSRDFTYRMLTDASLWCRRRERQAHCTVMTGNGVSVMLWGEKGSPPVLTVPEFLDGESSTITCTVHNAIPAPVIDIRVGNVLLSDALQTDLFNGSSHTFTNPPSVISMSVNKIQKEYNDSVSICYKILSCETNESNPPCAIDWPSNRDDLRYIALSNETIVEHGSYRFVSNAIYKVTNGVAGGTITCSTRCDHFSTHLTQNYTVSFSGGPTLYLNTTSPVDVPPDTTVVVKCTVLDEFNANGQYTLWWEDGESTIIKTCNKTDECLLTLNHAGDGERIFFCKKINPEKVSLKVLSSVTKGSQSHEKDIQTLFSTFRFPVNNVLIGAAVICGFCILFVIGRCIFLKRRTDNAVNTIEMFGSK